MSYSLQFHEDNRLVFTCKLEQELEVGRQQHQAEVLFLLQQRTGEPVRLAVAPLDETQIGRQQLLLIPESEETIQVKNLNDRVAVDIAGHPRLEPLGSQTLALPVTILLPTGRIITIEHESPAIRLGGLEHVTMAPGTYGGLSTWAHDRDRWKSLFGAEHLVQALQATMDIFQSAHQPDDLFASAIRGAVELVDFDRAQILLYKHGHWESAEQLVQRNIQWPVSQTVLDCVATERRTVWESEVHRHSEIASLSEVDAVIAAPILNSQETVIGVLYCDRRFHPGSTQRIITPLDARLIELLACGVASGVARMEQEDAAKELRHLFEQFFTKELAQELETNPDLLEGRDAEVSILFCDIRGFSRISERIGTQNTFDWINHVMGELSECVIRHQGVLVDYIGDEIMAMWGAPQQQVQHAMLACQAALEMLNQLPELNKKWEPILGEPIDLGIGINSGPVRAGNVGSVRKFKYSPLGTSVNLASRVQGATKYLKARLLITGQTESQLDHQFLRRKLGIVEFVNISESAPLFELNPPDVENPQLLCEQYEVAIKEFEAKNFRKAARQLSEILGTWPNDGPSLLLLKRSVNALVDGPEPKHPVYILEGK